MKMIRRLNEDYNFQTMFLLCGPSAVGKDTLAAKATHMLSTEGIHIEYANKYTTQEKAHCGILK